MFDFRRANSIPAFAATATDFKVVAVDRGPGWVEVWSPQCALRWRISSPEGTLTEDLFLETGPASKARIWVGELGATVAVHEVLAILTNALAVRQSDGRIVTVPAPPEYAAQARFYPAALPSDPCVSGSPLIGQLQPMIGPTSTTIRGSINTGQTLNIAYPPEQRLSVQVFSDKPLSVEVNAGIPGSKIPVLTFPAGTFRSFNLSPWHFLAFSAPAGPPAVVQYSVLFRDIGAVTAT